MFDIGYQMQDECRRPEDGKILGVEWDLRYRCINTLL
jgi:hypothetical protein